MLRNTHTVVLNRTLYVLAALVAIVLTADAHADPMTLECIWDQTPSTYAGPVSDTTFYTSPYGNRASQLGADDVLLDSDRHLARITWQGFYNYDYAPEDEVMRLRVYASRSGDELPGDVLYEELTSNHARVETGRSILGSAYVVREFTYALDLSESLLLEADERYWVEVSQVGEPDSSFRLVQAYPREMDPVFINPFVDDWQTSGYRGSAFQLWSEVPEPSSAMLLCLVLTAGLGGHRRRPAAKRGLRNEAA